jgi:hypothetical protein
MAASKEIVFPKEWYCPYGLVLPQPGYSPSDNGVLFTSVAKILGFDVGDYKLKVRSCYLKKGLIARWPKNNYDQCAWDDYLGVAAACIKIGETGIPREILWHAMPFFIFNTDGKCENKDWLGRHIHMWTLMWCAAFPILKWPLFILLWFFQLFFIKPDMTQTSGAQLQFVYLYACHKLGFTFKRYKEHEEIIHVAMLIYYHKLHPFNQENWKL